MIAETEFLHKNLSKSSTSGPVLRKRWKGTTGIRLSRPQGPEGFEAVMSSKYVLRIPEDGTDLYEDWWVKEPLKKTKTANGPAVAMNNKKKKLQKAQPKKEKEKVLALKVRKNLKVETVDLKTLHLKNTVKKEDNLKIF